MKRGPITEKGLPRQKIKGKANRAGAVEYNFRIQFSEGDCWECGADSAITRIEC